MDAKTIVILVLEAASFATGYGMAYLQGQSALEKERKSSAELVANQERIAYEKLVKAQDESHGCGGVDGPAAFLRRGRCHPSRWSYRTPRIC